MTVQIKREKLFRKMVKFLSFRFVVQEIWVFIFLVTSSIWRHVWQILWTRGSGIQNFIFQFIMFSGSLWKEDFIEVKVLTKT